MIFRAKRRKESAFDPEEILFDSVSMLRSDYAPEGRLEKPIEKAYAVLFLILLGGGIAYLLYRGSTLQIAEGATYLAKSQENRFSTRSLLPPRGIIYDRYGEALVENAPSFGIRLNKKAFREARSETHSLVSELGAYLGKPVDYFYDIGFPKDGDPSNLPDTLIIAEDIVPERFLEIAYAVHALPGVEVFENFRRIYQAPLAAAHAVGYLGFATENDINSRPEISADDRVGRSGIEAYYDSILRGNEGKKIVEIDALGRETRFKLLENASQGASLELTLDKELQEASYRVFSSYSGGVKAGSVIALDPNTGEVLALVSYPSFDTNLFSGSLSQKEFSSILENPLRPLVNRAISGEYPPGSTVKPMFGAAALAEGVVTDTRKQIYDPGYIEIPNPYKPGEVTRFLDNKAHGWIDFYDAIAVSANVYFYIVGGGYEGMPGLGIERLERYARAFGFGAPLGIDLYGEQPGLFPNPKWKETAEPDNPMWRVGDTYNVSIGQGGVKVTPLQIASMTVILANGGTLWRPYLLEKARAADGAVVKEQAPEVIRKDFVSEKYIKEAQKGMRQAVESGTLQRLKNLPVRVAAKTGTAQVGKNAPPHTWATVFAPADDPKIVVTAVLEHGGEGATAVVPIVRDILDWYFLYRPKAKTIHN